MDLFLSAITQGLAFAGLGIGIYLSLKIFNIPDITTDGSYTFGGAITAVLLMQGYSPLISILVAMIGGALAGSLTGVIHTRLKIHPLLAGILVMTGLYSINLLIMNRPNIPLINTSSIFTLLSSVSSSQSQFIICLCVALLISLLLSWLLKTDFGIAMRATGKSESMVRALGVNTDAMKIKGLALANALTALSGSLMVQYQGFADINMGIGIVISGLGAVIIGEALKRLTDNNSIWVNLLSVVLGTIAFRLLLALALSLGLAPNLLKLITSLLVLAVVALLQLSKNQKM
jgi:putative tryptophan/tyrosine transport system permease protein